MDTQVHVPPEKPIFAKMGFWQSAAAAILAVACVLACVLGLGNVGGWRRTQAVVHMKDAYGYTLTFDTPDGPRVAERDSRVAVRGVKDGQTMTIRYRVDDPTTVEPVGDVITLGVCLAVAALVLGALSVLTWREDAKRRKRWQRVAKDGVPYTAQVLNVYPDHMGLTRKARARYSRLDCVCYPQDKAYQQASGQDDIWLFTSERFLSPDSKFEGNVTVYAVPSAPDDYYVDLTTLTVDKVQDAPPADCI